MANNIFQGPSGLTLDGKGRMTMPSRHRELLSAMGVKEFTVTKHPEGALLVFPRPTWETFREKVAGLPMSASGWKRVFLGNAVDVEMDSASRILIAPELRASAGLKSDVMLFGMGSHFELWDKERYDAHEAKVLASPMPEVLNDLTF